MKRGNLGGVRQGFGGSSCEALFRREATKEDGFKRVEKGMHRLTREKHGKDSLKSLRGETQCGVLVEEVKIT